jgi:hypothetical protein
MQLSSAVVFITSNYVGNSELMQGCKEAGIPAFGTLWDFVSVRLSTLFFCLTIVLAVSDAAQVLFLLYLCPVGRSYFNRL